VDHDTYQKFRTEEGNPTYAYELNEAVQDGFLVPPKKVSVLGKFLSEGIKYADLTEEEKKQYDDLLADDETGAIPDHIDSGKLNSWLFNRDTVEQVLKQLMENGIKVEGGDRLGDTIIFAKNREHAKFIGKVFDENYPKYAGHFARVIHNKVKYAQDLIEKFCEPEIKQPVIAISVDMMDTGIDAPNVVNLVFFKPVRSKAKFNQMIGRGTRLREDLFGPGRHKREFVIFDFCGNFEFFDENPDGFESTGGQSVSAQIFEKRLLLAGKLRNEPYKHDEELQEYRERLLDVLHQQINNLERQSVQVRPHLKLVHKMEDRGIWEHLESQERKEIVKKLAEIIPVDINEHELSRRFDLLMLVLQHEQIDGVLQEKSTKETVIGFAEHLWQKRHIPAIKRVKQTLEKVMNEEFWKKPGIIELDAVRVQLREIMNLIDRKRQAPVFTDFKDEFSDPVEIEFKASDSAIDPARYRRKMKKFIEEHRNNLIIEKIRNAQPLTEKEIDSLEQFLIEADPSVNPDDFREIVGGGMELVKFIRTASGLDRKAVMKQFEEFLQDSQLSSNQIGFIDQMIEFYTQKGHLDVANLYEPPFNFIDENGIEGVFDGQGVIIDILVNKVRELNDIKTA